MRERKELCAMFGKKSCDPEERKCTKKQKEVNKAWQKHLANTMEYVDCMSTLNLCEQQFNSSIYIERTHYQDKMKKGLDAKRHEDRIRNAARGLRIVQTAKAELEDCQLDGQLYEAINLTCLAMKQLQKTVDSTTYINFLFNKRAEKLFSSREKYQNELDKMNLPSSIDEEIDQQFINDLIAGKTYEQALQEKIKGRRLPTGGEKMENLSAIVDRLPNDGSETPVIPASQKEIDDLLNGRMY